MEGDLRLGTVALGGGHIVTMTSALISLNLFGRNYSLIANRTETPPWMGWSESVVVWQLQQTVGSFIRQTTVTWLTTMNTPCSCLSQV